MLSKRKLSILTLCMSMYFLVPPAAQALEILSNKANGQIGYVAYLPAISSNGKWAAFSSISDLLPDDRNSVYDIYVRNLETNRIERISVANDGSDPDNISQYPLLSADGRFVAFVSYASNLVPGDRNNVPDVFVRDRLNGTTELVSIASDGSQGIYASNGASMSADGRYVAFFTASKLNENDTLRGGGIYLRDRIEQSTTLVAQGSHPALSGDGRFIAYRVWNNLLLHDLLSGTTEVIATNTYNRLPNNPYAYTPSISNDGRYVAYEGWSAENAPLSTEVFVYDRLSKTSRQITQTYDGNPLETATGPYNTPLKPQITADGRFIVFLSCAADIVPGVEGNHLYRHDTESHKTVRLEIDNLWATTLFPIFSVSGDGSLVVFQDTIYNHFPKYQTYSFGIFSSRSSINPGGSGAGNESGEISISASPEVLWPPNSKLTDVEISVEAPGAENIQIQIVDEYGAFSQVAYGNTVTIPLEAWRKGSDKDGRTYTINVIAASANGQQITAKTNVSVPHDKR